MRYALWVAFLLGVQVSPAMALSPVTVQLTPERALNALWSPPSAGRPTALVLHGFLQTRDAPIVMRVSDHLREQGYGVLAPTLSLGIDGRRQSLSCAAIHTHRFEDAFPELQAWVDWLAGEGVTDVVLIGHSSGASIIAAFLAEQPPGQLRQAVLISPVFFGPGSKGRETAAMLERAQASLRAGSEDIEPYALSYCDRYPSTPQAYLSYVGWDADRLAGALARAPIPVYAVIGEHDRIVPSWWSARLRDAGVQVVRVGDGDHFFRGFAEFELYAALSDILERAPQAMAAP
jgi:alpha-beta hydrolase superfamily lysophospholipase